jgi:predicted nucleic acid-binding protein
VIFVDSSALIAYLDADEDRHPRARRAFEDVIRNGEEMVTTNYVVVETSALLQRRIGMDAARSLHATVTPLLLVEWIGEELHESALAAYLHANRRRLSLVPCVSFEVMRRRGIGRALALDEDFRAQGFELLPG